MRRNLGLVTYLVRDYDEAIAYFTRVLGFHLDGDAPLGNGKRWVRVTPARNSGCALLLGRASTPAQERQIGCQAGDRVFLFLETDDFQRDYVQMQKNGVTFLEQPRDEAYGTVAVFSDLYGNKWDLLQLNR